MSDLTQLIHDWREGDAEAMDRVMRAMYPELKGLARSRMAGENPGHTLQPTALVNEAFLRLVAGSPIDFSDRAHFKAILATSMRRVLVDHARAKSAEKRGGNATVVTLVDESGLKLPQDDLIELEEGLAKLGQIDERVEQTLTLHYFGGLTYDEIASVLSVSTATVHSDLKMGRGWLANQWS